MKVLSLFFFIAQFLRYSNSIDITIPDVFSSGVDIFLGLLGSISDDIPTPSEIFQLSKNALIATPSVVISSAIDEICSAILAQDKVDPRLTPEIENIELLLLTACDTESFKLLESEKMTTSPNFDSNKSLVVIVSGWMTNPRQDIIKDLSKALICRNDSNVVVLDNDEYINTLYTWSAYNTEAIGEYLARSLVKLSKVVSAKNIHLIGHSLGAQIVGAAGRYYQEQSGQSLSHITGLDPAKPCFNQGETLPGVYRGNADFVDIFHSNPGVFGQFQALGDVDYYPDGLFPLKPGCLILGNICSHERAWAYYAESIYPNNTSNFLGTRCTSLTHLREGRCEEEPFVMGYAVDSSLKGTYFSEINADEPYGTDATANFQSSTSPCGECEESGILSGILKSSK